MNKTNNDKSVDEKDWMNFYDEFDEVVKYVDSKTCTNLDLHFGKNDKNYKIVSNTSCKNVQSEVSELRLQGWNLYKGIVVTTCNSDIIYTQVLIFNIVSSVN